MSFKILSFSFREILKKPKKTVRKLEYFLFIFEHVHSSKPALFIKVFFLQPGFGRKIIYSSVLPRADISRETWCLKPTTSLCLLFCTKESPVWKRWSPFFQTFHGILCPRVTSPVWSVRRRPSNAAVWGEAHEALGTYSYRQGRDGHAMRYQPSSHIWFALLCFILTMWYLGTLGGSCS